MNVYDTQVWQGDKWCGFFLDTATAQAWIDTQDITSTTFVINKVVPERKVRA